MPAKVGQERLYYFFIIISFVIFAVLLHHLLYVTVVRQNHDYMRPPGWKTPCEVLDNFLKTGEIIFY